MKNLHVKNLDLARQLIENTYHALKNIEKFRDIGSEDQKITKEVFDSCIKNLLQLTEYVKSI